jgi:glycosyltransferase involved in cell wall biosynthesis
MFVGRSRLDIDAEWPAAPREGLVGTALSRLSSTLARAVRRAGAALSLLTRNNLQKGVGYARRGDLRMVVTAIGNLVRDKQAMSPALGHAVAGPAKRFPVVPLQPGQPLVSVVIPCFNYGRFVIEALDSVLHQTLTDLEVIIVDGGSSDQDTLEILRTLERPRTRVVFRDGRHLVGDNRNFGIAQARGRYICCLDADDTLEPTYLEKAVFLLEMYGYDIVSTAIHFAGARSGTVGVLPVPDLRSMVRGNHVHTCAVFRRLLWTLSGGYLDAGVGKDHVAEDWDFWVRLAALGARIRNITDEPLFNYRAHEGGSLSSSADVKPLSEQRRAIVARNQALLSDAAYRMSEAQRERRLRAISVQTALTRSMTLTSAEDRQPVLVLAIPCMIVGGAERLLSQLCGYLVRQGWRVIVVTTLSQDACHGDSIDWFQQHTPEVYALPRFLQPPEWQDFVEHLMISRKPDCLLTAGSEFFSRCLPDLARRYPQMALVDLLFNTGVHAEAHRLYKGHYTFALAENADVLRWLIEAGWEEDRVRKVISGVDLAAHRPEPRPADVVQSLGIDPADLVIGFSGRLSKEKAPEIFLDIARLCQATPHLRFVMTGAGPMAGTIARLVAELPSTVRLDYLGLVDDVAPYLALYDVLVLPSRQDGRPLIVMEALASGLPVVASRLGGIPEMIEDGRNGFICTPADAAEFAACIRGLANDRRLVARLKVGARAAAESHLSAESAFARYESALHEAIACRRTPLTTVPERPGHGPNRKEVHE